MNQRGEETQKNSNNNNNTRFLAQSLSLRCPPVMFFSLSHSVLSLIFFMPLQIFQTALVCVFNSSTYRESNSIHRKKQGRRRLAINLWEVESGNTSALKEQYVTVAHPKISTALQIASWSHRRYVKQVQIPLKIQFMAQGSYFPSATSFADSRRLMQAAGAQDEHMG